MQGAGATPTTGASAQLPSGDLRGLLARRDAEEAVNRDGAWPALAGGKLSVWSEIASGNGIELPISAAAGCANPRWRAWLKA